MAAIPCPQKLSVDTALALFDIKIGPVAAYGISVIWVDMTATQLNLLDKVKATFLKRVLGLPRAAQNRLTYCLAGTMPFIEDLVRRFSLPHTAALQQFRQSFDTKMREVPIEFYRTQAMTRETWKQPLQADRHAHTRYAVHGFHHRLCRKEGFHTPGPGCLCKYCGQSCPRYHLTACPSAPSLTQLAR